MIGHIYPNWQSMIGLPHLHQEGRELLLLNVSMSQSIYKFVGIRTLPCNLSYGRFVIKLQLRHHNILVVTGS